MKFQGVGAKKVLSTYLLAGQVDVLMAGGADYLLASQVKVRLAGGADQWMANSCLLYSLSHLGEITLIEIENIWKKKRVE